VPAKLQLVLSGPPCVSRLFPLDVARGKCCLQAAVVGNHDLDFGLDNFEELAQQCNFPWLLANVLDNDTGGAS
jgi:hypothetical protein